MQRLLTVLLGPVFAKEMVEISRRRRYYLNRILYGTALLLALVIMWNESQRWQSIYGTGSSIQYEAQIAHDLFIALYGTQYAAVYLFVPIFVAGLIAAEREEKTLDLLFTTHLSDREIVLGKLASRLAVLTLLFLAATPIFSLITLFGGIDPKMVWKSLGETLLAMFFAGSFAIYFSAASRGQVAAVIRTYWWLSVWILLIPLGTLLGLEILSIRPMDPWAVVIYAQLFINPGISFLETLSPQATEEFERSIGPWPAALPYIFPILFSSVLMWRAVARLRKSPSHRARFMGGLPVVRWLWERIGTFGDWAAKRYLRPNRFLWRFPIRNPLWLRSRLTPVYDRDRHLTRIQYCGVLLTLFFFAFMYVDVDMRPEDVLIALLIPAWIAAAFFITIVSASSLVSDRRHGFFELLLTTDLQPREIVDGTLAAVWEHARIVLLTIVCLSCFMVVAEITPWYDALASLGVLVCFGLFLAMLGVSCSLVAPSVLVSLAATISLPLLMCVGVLFLGGLQNIGFYVLCYTAGALWCVAMIWIRRSISAFSIACLFISVQLVLVCLASDWVGAPGRDHWWAVARTSPTYLIGTSIENRRPYGHRPGAATVYYCGAMFMAFGWARWWTIRNFDKLVGRSLGAPDDRAYALRGHRIDLAQSGALKDGVKSLRQRTVQKT